MANQLRLFLGKGMNWHPVCLGEKWAKGPFSVLALLPTHETRQRPRSLRAQGEIQMIVTLPEKTYRARTGDRFRSDNDPIELTVFLSSEQAATLEEAARGRGLTIGQMIRRLVSDFTSQYQVAEYWY
jgi:hypothetical protein